MKTVLSMLCTAGLVAAVLAAPPLRAAPAATPKAGSATLKIGIVQMTRAINTSEAGKRSLKIFSTTRSQKENELKAKEAKLTALRDEIKSSIMLTPTAKADKEREYREQEQQLMRELQTAQRDLQDRWREMKNNLESEIQTVITEVSKERGFDLVLADVTAQGILYSRYEFIDITDEVIARYNKMHTAK